MVQSGLSIQISQDYSSMVNFARCKVLGANVLRGPQQTPWDGRLEYDYQLWIDNDIVFNTDKFWQLCDMAIPAEGEEKESLQVGMLLRMVTQPLSHTGWRKMISVRMAES